MYPRTVTFTKSLGKAGVAALPSGRAAAGPVGDTGTAGLAAEGGARTCDKALQLHKEREEVLE
jgi:hypothetical protein